MKGFNPLVPFYDTLASFVFLGAINRSQKYLASQIKSNSKVLILGGGTGKLLEYLDSSISVSYVELSEKMILKAYKRRTESDVRFYNEDFLPWNSSGEYDYILCPFFLDLFLPPDMTCVLDKIEIHLKPSGSLLVADFNGASKSFFHQGLLKMMFCFFRITGAIELKKYNDLFETVSERFTVKRLKTFYNGFVLVVSGVLS